MRRSKLPLLSLLLALLLAACSSTPNAGQPSESAPSAAPKAKPIRTTIANGGIGSLVFLPATLAHHGGFFVAENLQVEMKSFEGGAAAATALIGGQVDFAAVAVDQAVKAQAKGQDIVMIGLFTRYPAIAMIVDSQYKDQIKSIRDLKGKPVGISSKGSGSHLALIAMLAKAGLKESDISVVAAGVSTLPAALANGSIVAGVISDPFVAQLVQEGKAFILPGTDLTKEVDVKALYGSDYPFIGLATRKELLTKEPEKVQRVINAVAKTQKFIATATPQAIADKMPNDFKKPSVEIYIKGIERTLEAYSPDGKLTSGGVQTVIKALADSGQVDASKVKAEELFSNGFLDQVK
jgi:NitT/TauT family transport system substrate-binding protein